jgi:hypothetical protein
MKLIFFGFKEHGKDTACEYLENVYGVSFSSSSWYACKTFLFNQIKGRLGYKTPEECFEDRRNHRPLWYEAIRDYNRKDRARMGKEIFASHAIYCGIRDNEEFQALTSQGIFDHAIWVDASDRLPPEDESSMNVSRAEADWVIDNNGTREDLHRGLDVLAQEMGWRAK